LKVVAAEVPSHVNHFADEKQSGRAFFQGTSAAVSFDPFLHEVDTLLSRQFALTYLSTNTANGFHRIRIVSELADGEILHPTGYIR